MFSADVSVDACSVRLSACAKSINTGRVPSSIFATLVSMAQTPSPPDSPRSDLLRVIGSPAGRALAVKVEQACALIRPLEISDTEYALGSNWRPPIPIPNILHQVLRPAVFVLQQALDPSFHRTRYGSFQFPYTTTRVVQATLRKMMELVVCSSSPPCGSRA